ncbi:MAG TPA: nucleotidyl transferase AbiEii/AbiGii toxin family protein [Thermoanaerobaculia bacterium]
MKAMNREGVEYITFGAIALMAHGIVRATEDADFFIAPTVDNIERLKKALRSVWDDPSIDEIRADELMGDYPSVRYGPPEDDVSMDFLTRLGEVFSYETLDWQVADLDGEPLRVVTPAQLYRMKRDTVRHKDKIDAEALRVEFSLPEN